MPLADYIPRLDDRRFDDLLAEARARIPRYTPEWTDYNPGDAGFALVELYAWASDLLMYRLGRTNELLYLKFLQLIGIELAQARPARATIVFPVANASAQAFITVPRRTAVATRDPDEQGPIVFETERILTAINARLAAVQVHDGFMFTDASRENAVFDRGFEPFGGLANANASLCLGLAPKGSLAGSAELSLAFFTTTDRPVPPPTPCTGESVGTYAPARLVWEFFTVSGWQPLTVISDDTLAMTRTGLVRLRTPPTGLAVPLQLGAVTTPLVWLRARLERASYEIVPRLRGVDINAVPALQAQTVEEEILGGSDGMPAQEFRLANAPVLPGSLVLAIDEGDGQGFRTWKQVPDLFGSGPDDPHYVLDTAQAIVRLGDGRLHGRIPAANPERPRSNVKAVSYRFGGGRRGNVSTGTISVLLNAIDGIDAGAIANRLPAEAGTDEETIDAAVERAPRTLKSRTRAVTPEDFEALAREAGPIRRAKALPLFHPDFPGIEVPGVVTVIVVPDSLADAPRPSEGLLRTVCSYLDRFRLLGTELFVIGPRYEKVRISLRAVIEPDADAGQVNAAITEAIHHYLHPLTGGPNGTGWPFGAPIPYVELYRRCLVPGCRRIEDLIIELQEGPVDPCKDAPIPAGHLIELTALEIAIIEDVQAEEVEA